MSALLSPDQKRNRIYVCTALISFFMFILLTGCGNNTASDTGNEAAVATEEISTEPETEPEIPEIDFDELPELNSFDQGIPFIDTMGFGMEPLGTEDGIVETADDIKTFRDNGKMSYLAFKWITIEKTGKNTKDLDCQYLVDLKFRDGSAAEGLRCNDIAELKEGRKFRYGYVMDDPTQEDGEDHMYLYLVQE